MAGGSLGNSFYTFLQGVCRMDNGLFYSTVLKCAAQDTLV